MSGHSKWSTIKHKKGATDAKRGKIFTKLIKEITVAARLGGGDPEGNPRLRSALSAAKAENMPKDNIARAIKKGTGELDGGHYDEIRYEGYGPAGVAILIDSLTDNKNRTVAEVRTILSKHGGSMGEAGCVNWMFKQNGLITIEAQGVDEEKLMTIALDSGAEDFKENDGQFEIITSPKSFEEVKKSIETNGFTPSFAEVTMIPQNNIKLEGAKASQMIKLMETLEDNEDVQNVFANFDIPESEFQ